MEQLADPGSIVIAPETLALAQGYVEVRSLGPVPVKGLADPVETYELMGAGPRRSRLSAAAARGLTRFVGRDGELEQLAGRSVARQRGTVNWWPSSASRASEVAGLSGRSPLSPDPWR
jgi:hypothetical protein